MTGFVIRDVQPHEIAALPQIEADAAAAFREVGLDVIAEHPPMTAGQYADLAAEGHVLVAVSADESGLAGFAVLGRIDGQAWLREMSVCRNRAGQGIGRALLQAAVTWARGQGFRFIALTTFSEVPFNGPFYRNEGFADFDPGPDWPKLQAVRSAEQASEIEVQPRTAMICKL